MDSMVAYISILFIPLGAVMMLDAFSDRRYREGALFIVMTIVLGVIHYVSIIGLPDPQHFPWYWKVAFPVGIYLGTIFVALFVCRSKRKGK